MSSVFLGHLHSFDEYFNHSLAQLKLNLSDTAPNHEVDSVIESSLRGIRGGQNFALINFSLDFPETTIYGNKVFLENLVAVH